MKAEKKTKAPPVKELDDLRRRIKELEAGETKFKKSASALKESDTRFRNIIESAKDGIIFFDGKTRKIILGNSAMAELLGCSKEDLIGRSISSLHPSEEWASIEKSFKKHLRGELTVSTGIPLLRNDGSILYADIFSSLTMLEGRSCFSAFIRDITERKRTEEALRESEERYRSLFENSDDAILLTAPDGRIFQANPSACRMFGRTEAEIIQLGRNGIIDQTDPRLPVVLEKRKLTGRARGELTFKRRDGQLFPGEVTSGVFRSKDGLRTCMIIRDITERRRAEEALRESEEKYRNFVERANDGIGIGQDGIILFANTRLSDMIGYSIEEVVGKPVSDFFMRDEIPKDMDFYKRRMEGEDLPTIYETALRHKNGNRIEVELNGGLINYKGKPADLVIIRDITERKRAEEALRESEKKYRLIVENSRDLIFTVDLEGKFLYLSPSFGDLLGYDPLKFIGHNILSLIHPEDLPAIQEIARRDLKEGLQEIPGTEYRMRHASGEWRWQSAKSKPVYNEKGDFLYFAGVAQDITESRKLEEALRESEAKFRNMFDNASIGMSITSLDDSVYVNQILSEMLGYTKEELSDLRWQDFTYPDDIELTQEHIEQLLSGEETSVRFIKRYIKKDGSILWGDINTVLQKDKYGNPSYLISGLLDISERKRWEALIERTMRETRVRFEVSQALARKETEDEVLDVLIQQANLYPQTQVSILTFDKSDSELVVILRRIDSFSSGLKTLFSQGARFSASKFPTINRYSVDQLFVSDDILSDERVDPPSRELIRQSGGTSYAGFRLAAGNELLGLILAEAKPIGYFDKEKQQLYQTLAEQGAVALRAARLREQVRESQKRFQGLVETLNDVIWEVDENWVYTYVGPKIRDMLGVEPEELLGKTLFDLMPQEEARRVSGLFETLKAARQPMVAMENTCRHEDGRLIVFETSGLPFFDADGQFMGYRGVARDITERMQTQKALQISEERFRIAAENSNDFIYEWDLNTGLLKWFGAAIERLNHIFSEPPITTTAFEKSIHPEDYERISKAVRRQVRYGEPYREEYRLIGKTGDIFYIQTAGKCLRDEKGWAYKWIGTTSDITERKRAEEALRQAEEKYRAIVENAVEGIFQTTSDGKFLMANTAVARFHGYDSPEELIATISNIGEQLYVHPEDRQRYRRVLADEGIVKGFENQYYRKDGTINWGSMNVRSVRDHEGRILYYEGTIEDITARKEAELGLQKSLEKLRKALGGIVQAMSLTVETRDPYTAGHQRRVADLSRAIAQEMGLPEDQVDALRMAGNVHDLGKISIPAEILSKPVQLSDIEFSLIKGHPQISYDILKDIDFNWPVAEIVLQHHERINGSGYPLGLSGKAIYLEARILAVADVVEAISSHRPYRPAFGIDVALEEIEKNKDALYDPEAVEACLRLFREKGFKFE